MGVKNIDKGLNCAIGKMSGSSDLKEFCFRLLVSMAIVQETEEKELRDRNLISTPSLFSVTLISQLFPFISCMSHLGWTYHSF